MLRSKVKMMTGIMISDETLHRDIYEVSHAEKYETSFSIRIPISVVRAQL
jgi:hypothetical protein